MSPTPSAPREIVLVDCPDEVGMIHRITGVLQQQRLNIESNQEFVDGDARHFFFRAEVTSAAGTVAGAPLRGDLQTVLPPRARIRIAREDRRPIVVCASRETAARGTGLRARPADGRVRVAVTRP